MAKSRTPRTIIDEATGKEYQFNPDALKEIIHSRIDKKNHITQSSILQQLEEKCGLSVHQVQKWLSRANGIGNIENVKIISDFFNIDYHDILIDLNPTSEDKKMIHNEEKTFIIKVFGECVSVLYRVQEITNQPRLNREEKIEHEIKCLTDIDSFIRNIHMSVDQNSFSLQKYNRYNLHRILLELNEFMYGVIKSEHSCIPERWAEICDILSVDEAIHYPSTHNRDLYLESKETDDSYIYLLNEISLANEMGLTSCLTPTTEEWDNFDELEDYHHFGYTPYTERYSLTPSIIWLDLMIKELTEIFETDFPNIFKKR
ncbi:MAG: hypothetical protein E7253_00860 [Lachnospiraceae bacterium]|nr:hypothetical protein [Lachnospiraceae bacterium]